MNNHLYINNINKAFGKSTILNDISIEIKQGDFVSILGPSGCGKTTLLRIIAGLENPCSGSIFCGENNITKLSIAERSCGIVFQSYALFPNLSVADNITFGMKNASKAQRQAKVEEMLNLINLPNIAKKFPAELSGGMQQRVALARALALKPQLLLLDEPLSALDAKVRTKLREEICRIQKSLGITTIMVTHDQEEALTMADKIVVLNYGNVMQYDSPQALYQRPKNKFVADFIGHMNFIEGWQMDPFGHITSVNSDANFAFRPEAAIIVPPDKIEPHHLTGIIAHLEFRGSFYRAQVYLSHQNDQKLVDMDFQPKHVRIHSIKPGATFAFHIPSDRIHSFQD
ncbi:MAG: ATP-binding cassette domain-containing protein [Lentisphaeria bacterium]